VAFVCRRTAAEFGRGNAGNAACRVVAAYLSASSTGLRRGAAAGAGGAGGGKDAIQLIMTLTQKITRLQSLLERAKEHQSKERPDASFKVWKEHIVSSLGRILSPDAPETIRVKELTFTYTRGIRVRGVDYSEVDRESRTRRYKHDFEVAVGIIQNCLDDLLMEQEVSVPLPSASLLPLANLHPAVQQAAGKLFTDTHYPEAILKACIALDKAVAAKAQRPDLNGKQFMDVAFSPRNTVLRVSQDTNEQTGFMLLYQGVMQAIRNHYAHNDTAIEAERALEWLSFVSALFYMLDGATATIPTPAT